ncbi:MAG TPA: hypothetical protein VLV55_06100 [Rhizomicrobium sp.]|nr:hypothetical protein [Rhizomicrobium sp.]
MARHYFLHIAVAIAIAIAALVIIRLHSANGVLPATESAVRTTPSLR